MGLANQFQQRSGLNHKLRRLGRLSMALGQKIQLPPESNAAKRPVRDALLNANDKSPGDTAQSQRLIIQKEEFLINIADSIRISSIENTPKLNAILLTFATL